MFCADSAVNNLHFIWNLQYNTNTIYPYIRVALQIFMPEKAKKEKYMIPIHRFQDSFQFLSILQSLSNAILRQIENW